MSNYGAKPKADLNIAGAISHTLHFLPLDKANAMQWDSAGSLVDIKLAHRKTHSNCHFLFDTDSLG